MFPIYFVFILVGGVESDALSTESHYGTDFYVTLFPFLPYQNDITIDIASQQDGYVLMSIPYLSMIQNSTIKKGSTTLNISGTVMKQGSFVETRGIHIQTDVHVALFVSFFKTGLAALDSYLALPTTVLGKSYKVTSYEPGASYKTFVSAIGIRTNTTVHNYFRNQTTVLSLQPLNVWQQENNNDLTGTYIESDKIIAVVSGSSCAYIPHRISACDYLIEQMIPIKHWKRNIIVPPVFPKTGFVLKILITQNETVCMKTNTNTQCHNLTVLSDDEYIMGTEPVVVTSATNISVVQYGVGQAYDGFDGDPFMTVIPAVDNYLNEYYFVVPSVYSSLTHYLTVTVPSSKAGGLYLDGLFLNATMTYSVPAPFNNFSVIIANISVGFHELKHAESTVMFGANVYGLDKDVGYGFPVGFSFRKAEVDMTTTRSTVPISTTVSSSVSSTTMSRAVYNDSKCFSCEDMSHAEFCDVLQHCKENEICYLEKYTKSGGSVFRSGCLDKQRCFEESDISAHSADRCVHCCSEHFCNNKGCGENGLQPREQRGPMCYDCQHVGTLEECHTVTLCGEGQICSIEEFKWGTQSHFKMGCAHGLCNPIDRSLHVAPRALPVCHSCCKDDYCNSNCTHANHGQPVEIIG